MKKLVYTLSGVLAMMYAFTACDNGNSDADILNSPPGITLPETLSAFAGSQQTISVSFSEGAVSDLASATLTLSLGDAEIASVTESLSGDQGSVSLTFTVTEPGTYSLKVTASDSEGASSEVTTDIAVSCEPLASCVAAGAVTVIAVVPDFTTGDLGMIGSLTDWGGQNDIAFERIGTSNCFCAAVPSEDLEGAEFKFRLNSTWDTGEKTSDCEEIDNRSSTAAAGDLVTFTVAEWRNSDTFGGGCPN